MNKPNTRLGQILMEMAKYPEYEIILDTPGLAFQFNEFCKTALAIERLVLDHLEYKDKQHEQRKRRPKSSGRPKSKNATGTEGPQ